LKALKNLNFMGDELLDGLDRDAPLGERALSKLRWRCRRGLLENDLFIERFFNRHASLMTVGQARGMYVLMDLSDNDLMDLFMKRKPLGSEIETEEVSEVLSMLMA
jgi:antitoxin CptB